MVPKDFMRKMVPQWYAMRQPQSTDFENVVRFTYRVGEVNLTSFGPAGCPIERGERVVFAVDVDGGIGRRCERNAGGCLHQLPVDRAAVTLHSYLHDFSLTTFANEHFSFDSWPNRVRLENQRIPS